ncbi:MAG: hypothetical protein HUJ69_05215, partial [Lachnospiraceae bacterium]|nr:hypothetical protein [Lachnospiraceae bacterium]
VMDKMQSFSRIPLEGPFRGEPHHDNWILALDKPYQLQGLKDSELTDVSVMVLSLEGFAGIAPAERSELIRDIKEWIPHVLCLMRLPRSGRMTREEWVFSELKSWMEAGAYGAEVCRMGQLHRMKELGIPVWIGTDMGAMNSVAGRIYSTEAQGFCINWELTSEEMTRILEIPGASVTYYGKIPYMISEQCIFRERYGCHPQPEGHVTLLKDREGENMTVVSHCPLCYEEIFSEKPIYPSRPDKLLSRGYTLRVMFTDETPEEVSSIWDKIRTGKRAPVPVMEGHFSKGVE